MRRDPLELVDHERYMRYREQVNASLAPTPLDAVAVASEQHRRWEKTWIDAMRAARSQGYTLQQIADAAGLHNRQRAHQLTKETK